MPPRNLNGTRPRWLHELPLAIILLLAASTARADGPACNLQRLASLDMKADANGTLVVPVTLDNPPVQMAVDTGAVWSILGKSAAGDRSRQESARAIVGAGGIPTREFVTVPTVTLDHLNLRKVDFYLEPDRFSASGAVAGSLAANLLSLEDLEIDPGAGKVALYAKDHCPGRVVYWPHTDLAAIPFQSAEPGLIQIQVQLDGKPVSAIVDTGAAISILQADIATRLFDLAPGDPGVDAAGSAATLDGGRLPLYRHQFQRLSLGEVTFQHPWLAIAERRRPPTDPGAGNWSMQQMPDLVLGMHQLRALHLYVAYGEKMLYATTVAGDGATAGGKAATPADWFDYAAAKQAIDRAADAMRQGHTDQALDVLDGAIRAAPQLSLLYLQRANLYRVQHEPAAALDDFDHALALTPADASVLEGRGFVRLDLSDWPAAIGDFDAVLARKPEDAGALYGRSVGRRHAGDAAGAAADLAAAERLDPDAQRHFPLF
jgi:predicted aspartyl protease